VTNTAEWYNVFQGVMIISLKVIICASNKIAYGYTILRNRHLPFIFIQLTFWHKKKKKNSEDDNSIHTTLLLDEFSRRDYNYDGMENLRNPLHTRSMIYAISNRFHVNYSADRCVITALIQKRDSRARESFEQRFLEKYLILLTN